MWDIVGFVQKNWGFLNDGDWECWEWCIFWGTKRPRIMVLIRVHVDGSSFMTIRHDEPTAMVGPLAARCPGFPTSRCGQDACDLDGMLDCGGRMITISISSSPRSSLLQIPYSDCSNLYHYSNCKTTLIIVARPYHGIRVKFPYVWLPIRLATVGAPFGCRPVLCRYHEPRHDSAGSH